MNKEKLKRIGERLNKRLDRPLNVLITSTVAAILIGAGHNDYLLDQMKKSERIDDTNFERITMEEKEKLGLTGDPIKVEFFDSTKHESKGTSYCKKDDDFRTYLVVIEKGQERRGVLRHELYHVSRDHPLKASYRDPRTFGSFLRDILDEYSANVYAVHGVSLQK